MFICTFKARKCHGHPVCQTILLWCILLDRGASIVLYLHRKTQFSGIFATRQRSIFISIESVLIFIMEKEVKLSRGHVYFKYLYFPSFRPVREMSLSKGVNCFVYCVRANAIVTGGGNGF